MSSFIIREWDASYYCWGDKVWKYGKLVVCSNCIAFFEQNENSTSEKEPPQISLDLRRICGFQRRLVSLVFKAIVINVERARPQWFSSLRNREETYFFLEHFWQQRLLLGSYGHSSQSHVKQRGNKAGSAIPSTIRDEQQRQKLFEVLYDSENTLIGAAESLQNQGEEMDHSSRTMNRMHMDLNVAETLINGLDRWFTKWQIKPEHFYEISLKKEFPVLYRNRLKDDYLPGTLIIKQNELTVLNAKRVVTTSVLLKDLTNILVSTPWNVTLLCSIIGQPDITIDMSSAHVVYIIKALQHEHGEKFEYEESPAHGKRFVNFKHDDNSCHILPASSLLDDQTCDSAGVELPQTINIEVQEQQSKEMSEVDKVDLEKVSDVVKNMKSLATSIGQEVDRQLDSLDQLSESVDKANYRIAQDNRKLQGKI